MHHYKHHIGDYRRDTTHLSLLEHGCYRQLLDMYYLSEQPIPLETETVFRRLCARTDEEKTAIKTVLDEFFTATENGFVHKRCDTEIASYQAKADAAREAGKLGGRPKKTESESEKNRDGFKTEPSEKLTTNHKPLTINQSKQQAATPVGFAEFWLAYPKKIGKGAAEKSWKRLRPELKTVLQAIELAKRSEQWQKNGGEFIPHPATWLNQRRWEDEVTPVSVSQGHAKPWFLSWTGIVQEGERMGIERNPGEIDPAYKARVLQAANITQETIRKAQQDFAGVAA